MSARTTVLESLRPADCEKGSGRLKAPIWFLPERDLIAEANEKAPRSYKLTLPCTNAEFKVGIWQRGTEEQFLNHVISAKTVIEKIELWKALDEASDLVEKAQQDLEKAKQEWKNLFRIHKEQLGRKQKKSNKEKETSAEEADTGDKALPKKVKDAEAR